MYDFKLTPSGDIQLIQNSTISSCKISFSVSRYRGQRISFMTSGKPQKRKKHTQSISFYFQAKPERVMAEKNILGDKEKMQAARIELKTENKNVYNYDAGSTFYSLNHTIYTNEESLAPIQDMIERIMQKYFPSCTVTVEFKPGDGNFWCQTIWATVYDKNNKLIDSFEV